MSGEAREGLARVMRSARKTGDEAKPLSMAIDPELVEHPHQAGPPTSAVA